MKLARRYRSPLRAEQQEDTRRRILEATAAEYSATTGLLDFDAVDLNAIARRAKVAVRTFYRHFPSKRALHSAFIEWVEQQTDWHAPSSVDEVADMVLRHAVAFGRILPRARAASTEDPTTLNRRKRYKILDDAVLPLAQKCSPSERRKVVALFRLFASLDTYRKMTEQWDLSPNEAGSACAWATRVLIRELRSGRIC